MRSTARWGVPLVLALAAAGAGAQDTRIDVTLSHNGSDAAGKRLAAAVATDLQASKRMKLVKTSDLRLGLYLATMARGGTTLYAATWTIGGMNDDGYLTSKVGVCSNESIRSCARGLAAETDKHANVLWSMRARQAGVR